MIIVPVSPPGNSDPELLPVAVVVETRLDIIIVILRVLRYLGSVGIYGQDMLWYDSKESPLFINKAGEDPYDSANHLPSMTVDIGGYRVPDNQFLYGNAVNTSQNGTDFYSELSTNIQILIKARSDVEAYVLADRTAEFLKVLTPDILTAVENLDSIFSITAGKVVPVNDESSNSGRFECMVTAAVKATRYLNSNRYKGPAGSPDPVLNSGVALGAAGIQSRLNPNGTRPLFSYGSFVVLAGSGEEDTFTVTNQMLFSGKEGTHPGTSVDTAVRLSVSSSSLDFGDVEPGASSELTLGIGFTSQGEDDVVLSLPDFVGIDLPGFGQLYPGDITARLRG